MQLVGVETSCGVLRESPNLHSNDEYVEFRLIPVEGDYIYITVIYYVKTGKSRMLRGTLSCSPLSNCNSISLDNLRFGEQYYPFLGIDKATALMLANAFHQIQHTREMVNELLPQIG